MQTVLPYAVPDNDNLEQGAFGGGWGFGMHRVEVVQQEKLGSIYFGEVGYHESKQGKCGILAR
jgi:hypothetical protein